MRVARLRGGFFDKSNGCFVCARVRTLQSGAYKVVKEGFVLLQFAPAVATRQYDWTRKQVIRDISLVDSF